MARNARTIRIGITMGDPSGVGPWVIAKALTAASYPAKFVVIGDKAVFDRVSRVGRIGSKAEFLDVPNVRRTGFSFGKVRAEYGRASIEYLDKALELLGDERIDCLVTAPISKEAINLAGYPYSGHTEYLASRTGVRDPEMMLLNDRLRFVLATRHIPLRSVSKSLGGGRVYETVIRADAALKKLFSISRPRIAVCGLNPHASDNGLLGDEENTVIGPQVTKARRRVRSLIGPLPADTAVAKALHNEFDCLIAMYHDQALIPLKITGFQTGVNITLGLPFVRTSPLHGTAFDIASSGRADPASLRHAIALALRCTLNQKKA